MSDFVNVDFNEDGEQIVLKPNFYTMPQACEEIDEVYSTVRYWLNMFGDYLESDLTVRNKKFSSRDVELLKFIKKMLKNDGFTIKQVQDYLKDNIESFDSKVIIESPESSSMMVQKIVQNEVALIKEDIVNTIVQQLGSIILQIQSDFMNEIKDEMALSLEEKLRTNVESSVAKELDSKLQQLEQIEDKLDKAELRESEHINKITDLLKENLELRKREIELQEQNNKSFFKKIFSR